MSDLEASTTSTAEPEFCFYGAYERAVDGKNRVALPFRWRRQGEQEGAEQYVLLKGPDGSLNLMPQDVFLARFKQQLTGEPGRDKRILLRSLSSGSHIVEPDAQGRVTIPQEFLARVNITNRALVIGMGQYMELWNPQEHAVVARAFGEPAATYLDDFFA